LPVIDSVIALGGGVGRFEVRHAALEIADDLADGPEGEEAWPRGPDVPWPTGCSNRRGATTAAVI